MTYEQVHRIMHDAGNRHGATSAYLEDDKEKFQTHMHFVFESKEEGIHHVKVTFTERVIVGQTMNKVAELLDKELSRHTGITSYGRPDGTYLTDLLYA